MKIVSRISILILLLGLAACSVEVEPLPVPEPSVQISNASYQSEFTAVVEGNEREVICNDRDTSFSYTFTYSGDLTNWASYFEGVDSGTQNGRIERSITSTTAEGVVVDGNNVTVYFTLTPDSIPTLVEPDLNVQGIVVTPQVKGYTNLVIVVDDNGVTRKLETQNPIPVLTACADTQTEPVAITSSSYGTTGYTAKIGDEDRDVICDDRTTTFILDFEYTGDLERFNIYFEGEDADGALTGSRSSVITYTSEQIYEGFFSGVFRFEAGQTPRIVEGDSSDIVMTTQAISVTPNVAGYTRAFVQPNAEGAYTPLDFNIPIVSTCPN